MINEIENRVTQFIEYLKKQEIVKKYLRDDYWISGSSTLVYPITIWEKSKRIEMQWKSDKKIFGKFIERVKKENSEFIKDGIFWKSDGSCPSTITFYYQY